MVGGWVKNKKIIWGWFIFEKKNFWNLYMHWIYADNHEKRERDAVYVQERAFQLQKCYFCKMCREDNQEWRRKKNSVDNRASLSLFHSLAEETQSKASK